VRLHNPRGKRQARRGAPQGDTRWRSLPTSRAEPRGNDVLRSHFPARGKMTDDLGAKSIGHVSSYVTVRLVGQSLSALCTSSLQNVSAVGSSHSLSETMLFLSLTLFGLVSSEHNGTSLMLESEAYRPKDTMHAFYSDSIYYIRKERILSRLFFILSNFFTFSREIHSNYGVFTQKTHLFCATRTHSRQKIPPHS